VVSSLLRLLSVVVGSACASRGLRYLCVALLGCLSGAGCARQQSTVTSRSETAERLSAEARQAKVRGDSQSAEHLLTEAVDRNPGDCETRLELSEMLLSDGNTEAAIVHLQKLVDQNPDDPRSFVGLAEAMYKQRNLAEAERLVGTALELDPRQTRGLLLRGKIAQSRGNDERALDDYYELLANEPDHVEATMLIARLHLRHGNGRIAAQMLRSIVENPELEPQLRGSAQWLLGRCYSQDGRWSDAAHALASGISSRRGTPDDWLELADACWRGGEPQQAHAAVEQALRRAPTNSQAQALLAALDNDARSTRLPIESVVSPTDFSDEHD
jgi:predicted Zn-dependent protease